MSRTTHGGRRVMTWRSFSIPNSCRTTTTSFCLLNGVTITTPHTLPTTAPPAPWPAPSMSRATHGGRRVMTWRSFSSRWHLVTLIVHEKQQEKKKKKTDPRSSESTYTIYVRRNSPRVRCSSISWSMYS
ncbi:hypothetical protein BHE74_00029676 [Ensete ventricosum]|nr:hypothetical protein BHE74_00029676 [Ensete ventricosum]